MKKVTITIQKETWIALKQLQLQLQERLGKRITLNDTIKYLMNIAENQQYMKVKG